MTTLDKKTHIYTLSDKDGYVRYVGKTNKPKERLKEHLNESIKGKNTHKNMWIRSLLSNKETPMLEIVDTVPENEWVFWEQHYISLFKSWNFNLVNKTIGGNGTGAGIYNPNYGKKLTEEHRLKCSISLSGEKNPFYGKKHTESVLKKIRKSVLQYDMDGNFLKEWKSIKSIEETLKLHSISLCCNFKILSVGNFIWRFKNNENIPQKIKIEKTYKKNVYQYDLNGDFIKKWESVSDAEKTLGIKHISKVCNNYKSHKTSGGFKWYYEPK